MSNETETVRGTVQGNRRNFLKRAGLAVGTAGVVTVAGSGPAVAGATEARPQRSGYRETEHIRTYYELARF